MNKNQKIHTQIIGHRGAAGLELENTAASIKAALKLNLAAIELDVRRSQDNQLVVCHDAHTGHISSQMLRLSTATLKQIKSIKLHNGEQLLTLAEAFDIIGSQTVIMLDIKEPGLGPNLIALLETYPHVKVFLSGRHYKDMAAVHQQRPDIQFVLQHHHDPIEITYTAAAMGASGVCLNVWIMNILTYRLALRRGLKVYVYSVNWPWLLKFFRLFYPEAVLISDRPDRLVA